MGSLTWYVFRTTMVAFLITLITLTVVIWFTQAMRDFDLITSQRQTLFVFVGITGLIIPLLVMMLAPIALVISAAHVLNKLGSDSEIIVMNAAGISPWRLLVPFLASAIVVSILVAGIAAYVSPRQLARTARLGSAGSRRHPDQYRAAGPIYDGERRPHVSYCRPAARRPPDRHFRRRRPRSERAFHLPRPTGRDREERARLVSGDGRRQHPANRRRANAIRAS